MESRRGSCESRVSAGSRSAFVGQELTEKLRAKTSTHIWLPSRAFASSTLNNRRSMTVLDDAPQLTAIQVRGDVDHRAQSGCAGNAMYNRDVVLGQVVVVNDHRLPTEASSLGQRTIAVEVDLVVEVIGHR